MTKGTAIRGGAVLLLALLFGLGFGLNYGSSNQACYLLEAVKALHPNVWARDWLVTQTHFYHPAYAWLGTWLLRLCPSGILIACANGVFIAAGMLALYAILKRLAGERAFPAFCLLLALASVTRTLAPGSTYAFSEIFQPSTLGSLGFLLAAAAYVADRPLASGLWLALGGAFHVNYLVLGLAVFGVAWLLTGRARLVWRALLGLGPASLVLIFFLPFLLASASPGVSAEAQRIYQDVRSPHHYCVPNFAWHFATWAGFQVLGVAVLLGPAKRGALVQRRLLSLLTGCWLLVVPAALLSSVVVVRFVKQLMAWRICAQADLLAQAALCAALVSVFCDGRAALDGYDRPARAMLAVGLALLLLGSLEGGGNWNGTRFVLGVCAVAAVISAGWLRRFTGTERTGLALSCVSAAVLITLVAVNIARFSRLTRYSNVLSGRDPAVTELCAWAGKHTRENALFLTPPLEEDLRFQCRIAIVVDWKSPPAVPAEVLEWFARIENVSGRPVRGDADLAGYDQLDAPRVAKLRERYGMDYVIVERGHELQLGVAPVFSGQRFVAYALGVK